MKSVLANALLFKKDGGQIVSNLLNLPQVDYTPGPEPTRDDQDNFKDLKAKIVESKQSAQTFMLLQHFIFAFQTNFWNFYLYYF